MNYPSTLMCYVLTKVWETWESLSFHNKIFRGLFGCDFVWFMNGAFDRLEKCIMFVLSSKTLTHLIYDHILKSICSRHKKNKTERFAKQVCWMLSPCQKHWNDFLLEIVWLLITRRKSNVVLDFSGRHMSMYQKWHCKSCINHKPLT